MEDENERTPSYFAVLPAAVRYDKSLRPNAKLLYAEISALADYAGYCWASNRFLGDLFGLSDKTVSALVGTLAAKKYVRIEVLRDPATQNVDERRIWIAHPGTLLPGKCAPPPPKIKGRGTPKIKGTPPLENEGTPPLKNGEYNNIKKLNVYPYSPQGGAAQSCAFAQAFDAFWSAYPKHRDKKRAERSFYRLKPDEELIGVMLAAIKRQAATDDWQREDGKYIPLPTTWLNGERWTDEVEQARPSSPGGGGLDEWT